MDLTTHPSDTPAWAASSATAKSRTAAQRAAIALLDALAPERAVTRGEPAPSRLERHRLPAGCVLQAPGAAVSVSWFPAETGDAPLGELHVVIWRGVVTRRGSAARRGHATVVGDLVLRPVEAPADSRVWCAADGTRYDTPMLAAHCLALLEAQIGDGPAPDAATP